MDPFFYLHHPKNSSMYIKYIAMRACMFQDHTLAKAYRNCITLVFIWIKLCDALASDAQEFSYCTLCSSLCPYFHFPCLCATCYMCKARLVPINPKLNHETTKINV